MGATEESCRVVVVEECLIRNGERLVVCRYCRPGAGFPPSLVSCRRHAGSFFTAALSQAWKWGSREDAGLVDGGRGTRARGCVGHEGISSPLLYEFSSSDSSITSCFVKSTHALRVFSCQ